MIQIVFKNLFFSAVNYKILQRVFTRPHVIKCFLQLRFTPNISLCPCIPPTVTHTWLNFYFLVIKLYQNIFYEVWEKIKLSLETNPYLGCIIISSSYTSSSLQQ